MRALFVPFTPSLAHVSRCLAVAEILKSKNNECHFAIGTEKKDFIEKAGFTTSIIPEMSSESFINDRGWKWLTRKYFQENLDAELKIIDDWNPDIVVFDFRFTTSLSCFIRSKPSYSILHGNALKLIFQPKEAASEIIADNVRGMNDTFRKRIFRTIFPVVFSYLTRRPVTRFKQTLKKYNFRKIKSVFDLLLGDKILVADIPELLPPGFKLPGNFLLTGPLSWSGWEKEETFSFEKFNKTPFIYITMGSTVDAKSTLLKLIESLKDLPYNLLIAKGDIELHLSSNPPNVFIYSYVPGKKVAAMSSLVIFHGGHETLMQVLAAGVPSLIIPVNPDQILVAKQIQRLGLGSVLKHTGSFPMERDPLKNFSSHEIYEVVNNLLSDLECRKKCELIKKTIAEKLYNDKIISFLTRFIGSFIL